MIGLTILLGGLALFKFLGFQLRSPSRRKSVGLIVLGDIGRSPRMLYHAQSFVKNGYMTYIIAFKGSKPPPSLTDNENCHFIYLSQPLPWTSSLPRIGFLLFAPLKVLLGACFLLSALLFRIPHAPTFFFVQNPPSIPTLPIVQLAVLLRGNRLIIDWHNTGYSVLSLRLGSDHPVVKIAKKIEFMFGKKAFAHLMVTETMKNNLVKTARLEGRAIAFHDRPPRHFKRQTPSEAHELFLRLPILKPISFPSTAESTPANDDETLFTSSDGTLKRDRPVLLLTSTSHTPDEDLSILLRALVSYEAIASSQRAQQADQGIEEDKQKKENEKGRLPRVVMLVTGKGSGKESFEKEIERLEDRGELGEWVKVRTTWLELEDYPKLLGSSDLGISLHSSTSGFDLPMKVVDMFGCRLPVLALDFPSIGELVQDGVNGRTFKDENELTRQLIEILSGFQGDTIDETAELERLRKGITSTMYGRTALKKEGNEGSQWSDWETHWDELLLPLLDSVDPAVQ
ncbi:hypothetical protein JCM16303_006344 [Sporobolomyces ruberrimus]